METGAAEPLEELAAAVREREQARARAGSVLPKSVRLIASMMIVTGVYDALRLLESLAQRDFEPRFGAISLLLGIGLLRRSRVCLFICSLVTLVVTLVWGLFVVLMVIFRDQINVEWFGERHRGLSSPIEHLTFWGIVGGSFVFLAWCYHSLSKPATRAAFRRRGRDAFVPIV